MERKTFMDMARSSRESAANQFVCLNSIELCNTRRFGFITLSFACITYQFNNKKYCKSEFERNLDGMLLYSTFRTTYRVHSQAKTTILLKLQV